MFLMYNFRLLAGNNCSLSHLFVYTNIKMTLITRSLCLLQILFFKYWTTTTHTYACTKNKKKFCTQHSNVFVHGVSVIIWLRILISYSIHNAAILSHTLYIIVEKMKLDLTNILTTLVITYIGCSLQVLCIRINCIPYKSLYDSVCVKRHITRFAHGHTNRHNFLYKSIPPTFHLKFTLTC